MRARRSLLALTTAAVAAAGMIVPGIFAAPAGGEIVPTVPVPSCTPAPASYPCLESVSHGGIDLPEGTFTFFAATFTLTGDPSRYLTYHGEESLHFDIGAGELSKVWSVTFDMGTTFVPRVATGHARSVEVTRSYNAVSGHYKITVAGKPVPVTNGCVLSTVPWWCPYTATSEWDAVFDGQITDYGQWSDAAERSAMYGMNYFTNLDATSVPPQIVPDPLTGAEKLFIEMANSHQTMEHTVVSGHSELRIPNAFLRAAYGVPDPSTMTGSGLIGTVSGSAATAGTVDVWQEAGNDAMRVQLDGVTFSYRTFTVRRGTITPTRPTNVHTRRTLAHRGRVAFTASKPRGAKVTGYRARCAIVSGTHVVYATGSSSPIVVTGLQQGRAYSCKVRALSKAGPSRWSSSVRMPRYPS